MTTIVIDPVARIEGHLRLELDVENGAIQTARNVATLYRGFENIVLGRDPRDALRYFQPYAASATATTT